MLKQSTDKSQFETLSMENNGDNSIRSKICNLFSAGSAEFELLLHDLQGDILGSSILLLTDKKMILTCPSIGLKIENNYQCANQEKKDDNQNIPQMKKVELKSSTFQIKLHFPKEGQYLFSVHSLEYCDLVVGTFNMFFKYNSKNLTSTSIYGDILGIKEETRAIAERLYYQSHIAFFTKILDSSNKNLKGLECVLELDNFGIKISTRSQSEKEKLNYHYQWKQEKKLLKISTINKVTKNKNSEDQKNQEKKKRKTRITRLQINNFVGYSEKTFNLIVDLPFFGQNQLLSKVISLFRKNQGSNNEQKTKKKNLNNEIKIGNENENEHGNENEKTQNKIFAKQRIISEFSPNGHPTILQQSKYGLPSLINNSKNQYLNNNSLLNKRRKKVKDTIQELYQNKKQAIFYTHLYNNHNGLLIPTKIKLNLNSFKLLIPTDYLKKLKTKDTINSAQKKKKEKGKEKTDLVYDYTLFSLNYSSCQKIILHPISYLFQISLNNNQMSNGDFLDQLIFYVNSIKERDLIYNSFNFFHSKFLKYKIPQVYISEPNKKIEKIIESKMKKEAKLFLNSNQMELAHESKYNYTKKKKIDQTYNINDNDNPNPTNTDDMHSMASGEYNEANSSNPKIMKIKHNINSMDNEQVKTKYTFPLINSLAKPDGSIKIILFDDHFTLKINKNQILQRKYSIFSILISPNTFSKHAYLIIDEYHFLELNFLSIEDYIGFSIDFFLKRNKNISKKFIFQPKKFDCQIITKGKENKNKKKKKKKNEKKIADSWISVNFDHFIIHSKLNNFKLISSYTRDIIMNNLLDSENDKNLKMKEFIIQFKTNQSITLKFDNKKQYLEFKRIFLRAKKISSLQNEKKYTTQLRTTIIKNNQLFENSLITFSTNEIKIHSNEESGNKIYNLNRYRAFSNFSDKSLLKVQFLNGKNLIFSISNQNIRKQFLNALDYFGNNLLNLDYKSKFNYYFKKSINIFQVNLFKLPDLNIAHLTKIYIDQEDLYLKILNKNNDNSKKHNSDQEEEEEAIKESLTNIHIMDIQKDEKIIKLKINKQSDQKIEYQVKFSETKKYKDFLKLFDNFKLNHLSNNYIKEEHGNGQGDDNKENDSHLNTHINNKFNLKSIKTNQWLVNILDNDRKIVFKEIPLQINEKFTTIEILNEKYSTFNSKVKFLQHKTKQTFAKLILEKLIFPVDFKSKEELNEFKSILSENNSLKKNKNRKSKIINKKFQLQTQLLTTNWIDFNAMIANESSVPQNEVILSLFKNFVKIKGNKNKTTQLNIHEDNVKIFESYKYTKFIKLIYNKTKYIFLLFDTQNEKIRFIKLFKFVKNEFKNMEITKKEKTRDGDQNIKEKEKGKGKNKKKEKEKEKEFNKSKKNKRKKNENKKEDDDQDVKNDDDDDDDDDDNDDDDDDDDDEDEKKKRKQMKGKEGKTQIKNKSNEKKKKKKDGKEKKRSKTTQIPNIKKPSKSKKKSSRSKTPRGLQIHNKSKSKNKNTHGKTKSHSRSKKQFERSEKSHKSKKKDKKSQHKHQTPPQKKSPKMETKKKSKHKKSQSSSSD
ncbi:protein restricted tev movement 2 [Anaeramoeba flamelloides]|uniref:Protein restricted tev movement 2 n=1 Tax=Anaeramoeba flamelloides TaxID=1746091 RepID=A0ABQ8XN89_9EUKA|nr:protein restricted tev movement 2 [Anaeramoeba flamelloides]